MNDVIDPATGLPLKFPNSAAEAYARAGISSIIAGRAMEADRRTHGNRDEHCARFAQARRDRAADGGPRGGMEAAATKNFQPIWCVNLLYHGIRLDWLKPLIPAYLHILQSATEEAWFDRPIRIASAEGLILLKLLAFRTQDQVDIENLVAANSDKLDLDWIRAEWQNLAALDDPRMRRLLELVSESRPTS